jgi:hypothetical protein
MPFLKGDINAVDAGEDLLYRMLEMGMKDLDNSAVIGVIEQLAGVKLEVTEG